MADPSDMALTPASLSLADINAQLAPATEAQPGTDAEQIANAMLAPPPADERLLQVDGLKQLRPVVQHHLPGKAFGQLVRLNVLRGWDRCGR